MKKHASISKKNILLRVAAFVFAAAMLLSVAACSESKENASSEETLTEVNIDELDQDLKDFLIRFTDWYEPIEGKKNAYDCKKAGNGDTNILRSILSDAQCVNWSNYPVNKPKEVYNTKKLDPKKWAKESGGSYLVFESKDADWIATNIFNVSEEDIENMLAQAEENKWFYLNGGKYYKNIGGVGDPFTQYTFDSAKTDGTVYYINYSAKMYNGEDYDPFGTYTAEVEKKTFDGANYWTLNKYEQTSKAE